jgi:hypothetical protein
MLPRNCLATPNQVQKAMIFVISKNIDILLEPVLCYKHFSEIYA